jgi:DNA polymerase sliding clamp subunit (PCNA homolog)
MKLRISRDELLTGLQRVQGVVEKRNTMPILSNILLEARADGVDILATDLEIGMRGLYKATVEEPGSVTLSARKLYEILKELRDCEIELMVSENKWTTIQAGKSQFKIVGLPSSEYPPDAGHRPGEPDAVGRCRLKRSDPQNALCRRR